VGGGGSTAGASRFIVVLPLIYRSCRRSFPGIRRHFALVGLRLGDVLVALREAEFQVNAKTGLLERLREAAQGKFATRSPPNEIRTLKLVRVRQAIVLEHVRLIPVHILLR